MEVKRTSDSMDKTKLYVGKIPKTVAEGITLSSCFIRFDSWIIEIQTCA